MSVEQQNLEANKQETPENKGNMEPFIDTLSRLMKDGKLDAAEKAELIAIQEELNWIQDDARSGRNDLIDTPYEVIKAVRNHPRYQEAKEAVKAELSRNDIIHLQKAVWASVDGWFGPNTFMNFIYAKE